MTTCAWCSRCLDRPASEDGIFFGCIFCKDVPSRVRLSRQKGWRIPENTVKVDRSTRFGNPCVVGMFEGYSAADAVRDFKRWIERDLSVRSYDNAFGEPPSIEDIKSTLRGKHLGCWCKTSEPCHADVLLEIANS